MTRKEQDQMRSEIIVNVAMPRSEWLLLETLLVVIECGDDLRRLSMPSNRLRQIKHFIIEAERRACEYVNSFEIDEQEPA